jgi:hypothetical protein
MKREGALKGVSQKTCHLNSHYVAFGKKAE